MKWNILHTDSTPRNISDIVDILLTNRGISSENERSEFFHSPKPSAFTTEDLKINQAEVGKAIKRLEQAKEKKEKILIYGDYDADGVCSTAILWETLHGSGFAVTPYIPDRFTDGYGINATRVAELVKQDPDIKLIITVDNGIVAHAPVEEITTTLGLDVIITDHHQSIEDFPKAYAIIHTDVIAGSGVAWVFANELYKAGAITQPPALDLVAIGTIADILPLLGPNRSFVKYGLQELNKVKRLGIAQLCIQAGMNADEIGVYEVGFVIAPRLNSMGRLKSAMDSLRLLCTKKFDTAQQLAMVVSRTNLERQQVVEEVIMQANQLAESSEDQVLIIAHESFHEGVIGLAASKLVEKFYRPAIVIAKGETVAKASARSIEGFNMIENIRRFEHLIIEGGGHPQAAGFSIALDKIEEFTTAFCAGCKDLLTEEILTKSLKIDTMIPFEAISWELMSELEKFEPTGNGNKQPVFYTEAVEIVDFRPVGSDGKHLKITVRKDSQKLGGIGFGLGNFVEQLQVGQYINVAYAIETNTWNGNTSLQLKIKDIQLL